jgi:hypothetical protein
MPIRSDISSVFYLLLLGDVANYSPLCGQLYLFSIFIIRWTSYIYHYIRIFVSSRVCGILVVEGTLLICMYCNVCLR